MANRGDQPGSPGLHLLQTLHVYPPNRGPELGTVLQQRPYQCPVQGKHRLLIPVAEVVSSKAGAATEDKLGLGDPHTFKARRAVFCQGLL